MNFAELSKVAAIGARLATARSEERKTNYAAQEFYERHSAVIEDHRAHQKKQSDAAAATAVVERESLDAWAGVKPESGQ